MEPTHHVRVWGGVGVSVGEAMETKLDEYRANAFACEKNAKEATDRVIKRQWEDLAIQWHYLSNQVTKLLGTLQSPK